MSLKHSGHALVAGGASGIGFCIGRHHDKEINRDRDHEKCDDGVEEVADHNVVKCNRAEVRFAGQVADDRRKHVLDERCNHGAEGAAHDDANGEIENIAAQNKVSKSFEHFFLQIVAFRNSWPC